MVKFIRLHELLNYSMKVVPDIRGCSIYERATDGQWEHSLFLPRTTKGTKEYILNEFIKSLTEGNDETWLPTGEYSVLGRTRKIIRDNLRIQHIGNTWYYIQERTKGLIFYKWNFIDHTETGATQLYSSYEAALDSLINAISLIKKC